MESHVTNYEDSEFMINAYKRKKAQYERYKKRCLKVESELHLQVQRARIMEEENRAIKKKLKRSDMRVKKLIQTVAQNEAEGIKKSLELRTRERDMYKEELEKARKDNARLRGQIQEVLGQNKILKKKVTTLELEDEISPEKKTELLKSEVEAQVSSMRRDFDRQIQQEQRMIESLNKRITELQRIKDQTESELS